MSWIYWCITVKFLSWSDISAVHTALKTEGTLSVWSNVTGQNESAETEINVIHISMSWGQ